MCIRMWASNVQIMPQSYEHGVWTHQKLCLKIVKLSNENMVNISQPHESKISKTGLNKFICRRYIRIAQMEAHCNNQILYRRVSSFKYCCNAFFCFLLFLSMPNLKIRRPHNICGLQTPSNFWRIRMNFQF